MPQRPDRWATAACFQSSAPRFRIRAKGIGISGMRHRRAWWPAAMAGVSVILLVALPPPAGARKLKMSGTWAVRNGQLFLPLQFAATNGASNRTWTSLGDLSKGFGLANGPILGSGVVTATGSDPATLRIPRHRFQSSPSAGVPLWSLSPFWQITTMLVVDAPYETATLRAGGGPGSFTWCPDAVLGCPAIGPPNGGVRNGRVIYRAGANQFGGAMQVGLGGGGTNGFAFNIVPVQVGLAYIIGTSPTPRTRAAGRGTAGDPWTRRVYLPPGVVTQPTMSVTTQELVRYPGPRLTTMLGLSTTGTGPIFRLAAIGTSAGGMSVGLSTTEFGFAHTTGTVIVQQTAGSAGDDFFTVMGSDVRTAHGAGNISTVAGGISFRNTLAGQTPYATFHKVWFSLAPPVPSLTPAGLAAAAALVLLAVGYGLRPRSSRNDRA